MDKQTVRDYWQTFQDSLPPGSAYIGRLFLAEGWGDSPQMADELGGLIAAGIKTATCSAVWEWQAEGQDWPAPGAITVVLDGRDEPLCIVETIEVTRWTRTLPALKARATVRWHTGVRRIARFSRAA